MTKKSKYIRVKLITNPRAGKNSDAANNLKLVAAYLQKNNLKVDIALAKSKEKATPVARKATKDGYKIVIAMGGDGTVKEVMRGLIGSKARLGIIPVGIENNIARGLGIPADLEEACALIASDNTLKVDVGQVKTNEGNKSIFFEMVTIGLSAAIYPDASKVVDKLVNPQSAAPLLDHKETNPKAFLTLDDETKIEAETMLTVVCNIPGFGINRLGDQQDSTQESHLDVMVYPDFNKAEILRYLATVSDRGYTGKGKIQHYQAQKLRVKTSPKLDVMVDGLGIGRGTVTIKVVKNALRVITAQKKPEVQKPQPEIAETQPLAQQVPAPPAEINPISGNL